jgi:hypothetical protein
MRNRSPRKTRDISSALITSHNLDTVIISLNAIISLPRVRWALGMNPSLSYTPRYETIDFV